MKELWLVCNDCGYAKKVTENEVYDCDECPLCRGKMALDLNQGNKMEQEPVGDNFPQIKERELSDTEKLTINSFAQEIKTFGEERVWQNLNTMPLTKRLDYVEIFFSAKKLLTTEEY